MKNQTNATLENADCPATCVPDLEAIARFQAAIHAIAGKWKIEILCVLIDGPLRFGQLRRALPGITQHMLTAQLRELADSGLLTRTAFAEVPPRVDYELTKAAYALLPVFRSLRDWAEQYGGTLNAPKASKPHKNGRPAFADTGR
jgi:DNA-binding HxlR family transcriptional regulator